MQLQRTYQMTQINSRKTSPAGLELITRSEGERLVAYLPTPDDVWTIGVGHTQGVYKGMVITKEESQEFLKFDVMWAEKCVNTHVRVPLNQDQFDALVCFVFNIGCTAFKNSTLLRKLNNKDYAGAAAQLPRWDKQGSVVLPGLTVRRHAEMNLFLTGVT